MSSDNRAKYIPALGFHWLTPFYDLIAQITVRERVIKQALIQEATLESGQRVLDLGCGTGTLALWIKQTCTEVLVTGLDADQTMLARAAAKTERNNSTISFHQGMSWQLPYQTASFDQVVSSLFFHHLNRLEKEATLREIFRVLKPGGRLLVLDWGKPENRLMRLLFFPVQIFDGFPATRDNVAGFLPGFFLAAGLQDPRQQKTFSTLFGTIAIYTASKPASSSKASSTASGQRSA